MSIGDDEVPAVKILNEGDCAIRRVYAVRADIFPEMQTCCEQRDYLKNEIKTITTPPQEGLIMKTPAGDLIISFTAGVLAVLIASQIH